MLLFFLMKKNPKHTFPWMIEDGIDRETGNFFFECEPVHRVLKARSEILDYHKILLGYHYYFKVAELHQWYQFEVLDKQRFPLIRGKNGRFGYLIPMNILRSELPQSVMSNAVKEIMQPFSPEDDEPNLDDIPF